MAFPWERDCTRLYPGAVHQTVAGVLFSGGGFVGLELGRPRFGILSADARKPPDLDPCEGSVAKQAIGKAAAKLELPAEVREGEQVGLRHV